MMDWLSRIECDVLLIVPPFAGIDRPSLGAHILQSCARKHGFRVNVLYANLLFATEISLEKYHSVCYGPTSGLIGERFFSHAAFGIPPFGTRTHLDEGHFRRISKTDSSELDIETMVRLEQKTIPWLRRLGQGLKHAKFEIVGCSSTFEQTAASIAILRELKRCRPSIISLMGGANCEEEMATGVLTLSEAVDFVFSGECEESFPAFLNCWRQGNLPTTPVIEGYPCKSLDEIPTPEFDEYYEQLGQTSDVSQVWIPYETSRGCWWGQKHHCTFCGINGTGMGFREKSADRIIDELKLLTNRHHSKYVCMTDNIMPASYFNSLLPRLRDELPGLHIFYEQKANLTLGKVKALKDAGVAVIQPGIEALSTPLLKLMDKGITAEHNIRLLRYARAVDVSVNWNLLYGFPNDRIEWYARTAELIPLIVHLHPPSGLYHLSIDRFSPYFDRPGEFNVSNIRPIGSYYDCFPASAHIQKVAYHFVADYPSESRAQPELLSHIEHLIGDWRTRWRSADQAPPVLSLSKIEENVYLLLDTREVSEDRNSVQFVGKNEAVLVATGKFLSQSDEIYNWAVRNKLVVEIDSHLVPLATCDTRLLEYLEGLSKQLGGVAANTKKYQVVS